jgi:hypothetical protein
MDSRTTVALKRLLWLVLLILVVPCFVLLAYVGLAQMQARAILDGVRGLKVGMSTQSDVERITTAHPALWLKRWSRNCENRRCDLDLSVNNSWLYALGLEPQAIFWTQVTTEHGTVSAIFVDLSRDTRVFPTAPSAGQVREYAAYPDHARGWRPAIPRRETQQRCDTRAAAARLRILAQVPDETWRGLRSAL